MTKITLYKLRSGFANVADNWSMDASRANTYDGDYAKDFALPSGFRIAKSVLGQDEVYDEAGRHYDVSAGPRGLPVLVGVMGMVALEEAA